MSTVHNLVRYLQSNDLPLEVNYFSHTEKFTLLIATYINDNVQNFELALKSIVYNTVVPDEILITVDGPVTDEMNQLLTSFTKRLPNVIRVIRQESNKGRGYTAALGVRNARHELIAKMDADDISNLQRFEKQLPLIQKNNNLDVVGGQISEFDDELEVTTRRIVPITHEKIIEFSRMRSPINQPTVIFRKSSVLQTGNYSNLNVMEDYDLWMRMIENKMVFHNIDEDLVYMRAPKDMYQRRGGVQYFKTYKIFRKNLLKRHLISYKDYYKSVIAMSMTSLMPTIFRKKVYSILLRKDN